MIKVSDLVLAVGFLAFFLLIDAKNDGNNINTDTSLETPEIKTIQVDSLSKELDVYDSYADFTY